MENQRVIEPGDDERVRPDLDICISVNERPVTVHQRRMTGLEIKQAAIGQGVRIQLDFVLSREIGPHRTMVVRDDEHVALTDRARFLAVAPDDNS